MAALDARVCKRLPAVRDSPAFQLDLQLQCAPGISVVFGPSGAGKTLLLNCLAGFVRPEQGRILVDDQIYFDSAAGLHLRPEQRRCAYIFQDHALFPHMTVRGNLRFAADAARGAGRLQVHRRMNELLEAFDLQDLGNRVPAQLSGGQKQRAALARILMTDPKLILLDEPSRGLDGRLRQSFWDLLRSLRAKVPSPILLVSHDMEECCELADFALILEAGKCLQWGAREQVLSRPASVEVARLLGLFEIAPAEIRALDPGANLSRLRVFDSEIECAYLPGHLIGDRGFVCLKRSELRVNRAHSPGIRNQLTLPVERRQLTSLGVRLELAAGFSVTLSESESRHWHDGDLLAISVPHQAVTFLAK